MGTHEAPLKESLTPNVEKAAWLFNRDMNNHIQSELNI